MGLEPKKLHLETEKRSIKLKLDPFDGAEQSEEESVCDEAKIGAMALIISKNHISMESYHELSMVYEDMARSCEVSIQLYLVIKSHFGFHISGKKFLKDMEVLPIMKTPGEFDGAEFCFADLLKYKKIYMYT